MSIPAKESLQASGIMPSLTVNNLQESLRFYEALGFTVDEKWEQEGVLLGAMLKAGHCQLGLSQDDGQKGRDRVKGVGIRLYIEAGNDIDAMAAQAKHAGLTLAVEPRDTEWGARAFDVVDPSGFLLTISSPAKS